jgi:hypothetical protein
MPAEVKKIGAVMTLWPIRLDIRLYRKTSETKIEMIITWLICS